MDALNGVRRTLGSNPKPIHTTRELYNLLQCLKEIMEPVLGRDEDKLKLYEMKNLDKAVQELILFKVTHPYNP